MKGHLRALPPGPGIIKDWVKSLKHHWEEACFVSDVHDESELARVATRFLELRGADLERGVVVHAFEDIEGPEARTWRVEARAG